MLAHFGGELTLRQLAGRFQFDGDAAKLLALDVFAKLAFGFTRTKDQQRVCTTNTSQHVVIDFCAAARDLSFTPIFRHKIIRRVLVFGA